MDGLETSRDEFQKADALELSGEQLHGLGFRNLGVVQRIVQTLSGAEHGCCAQRAIAAAVKSCDPDLALIGFERWLSAHLASAPDCAAEEVARASPPEVGGDAHPTNTWRDPAFVDLLCLLLAATPALSGYLIRHPRRAYPVLDPVLARQAARDWSWRGKPRIAVSSAENLAHDLTLLRRMRVESMLQIAALDLAGRLPLEQIVRALSDLADACVQAALDIAVQRLLPRFGIARPCTAGVPPVVRAEDRRDAGGTLGSADFQPVRATVPFVVFALGKLGGRELNYSSDIDLVFVHAGAGETVETSRPMDAESYFAALGREIISVLDKLTEDGRVYRVDMRLRPYGSAGPLAMHAEDFVNYFQTQGRTWERQAWLKARPVAGDLALGNQVLTRLDAFIFRRLFSLDAIADLKALKRQIELSVERRSLPVGTASVPAGRDAGATDTSDEVKLGHGGIRDIEFTVQFLQLLHGGEHPGVRSGNTLQALYQLRREGLLSDLEVDPLANAYILLRNIEHRLQMHGDLQTHRLPRDPALRRRLALSLRYRDEKGATGGDARPTTVTAEAAFENDRARHTARTREVFMHLFANLFNERGGPEGELSDLLLAPQADAAKLAAILPRFGFPASDASLGSALELIELSREKLILTSPSRTRKFFASVAPKLLKALAATGLPEDSLRRFSRIAGSLGAKAVFYQMLDENPWLLKMTANLAAWSEYLAGILVANPGLFDELVDALRTGETKSAERMRGELKRIVHGGDIADTLRAYKSGELLRIGVRDLIHSASLEQTQGELSDLAEAVLRTQLEHTLNAHRQRRGECLVGPASVPAGRDAGPTAVPAALPPAGTPVLPVPVGFAVLALGKFGGREMNYGSDLDVIFFYGEEGQTNEGLPAVTYFGELAQALIRTMATPTSLGSLYELDARLRPDGSKGPLALSLDYFTRYWKEGQLADWERMALTRVRFVAGDEGVGERALHLIRNAAYSPLKDTRALAREAVEMRRRLEEGAESGDFKRGPGGIVDIEFIAQYLQLIHGPSFPPLRQANTERALQALMKFKKLAVADCQALLKAYAFLRHLENRVRVVHGLSDHRLPRKSGDLRQLALRAGFADSGQPAEALLIEEFSACTRQVREIFLRLTTS